MLHVLLKEFNIFLFKKNRIIVQIKIKNKNRNYNKHNVEDK